MAGWDYYIGKKVYIVLNDNRKFEGIVLQIDSEPKPFMWIKDKFGYRVCFSIEQIETIKEER